MGLALLGRRRGRRPSRAGLVLVVLDRAGTPASLQWRPEQASSMGPWDGSRWEFQGPSKALPEWTCLAAIARHRAPDPNSLIALVLCRIISYNWKYS